ncbi:hypothetical protein COY44_02840 [Candidatus Berkelbacteria bacterium CG_4_10_14_0_8_um_filter_39_42]|nr:MAG: hypothetical protein COY44_02840 [Candidatus Berkelbacteria bacterium CG_4_10_14_0_8_um_filter_39_42]
MTNKRINFYERQLIEYWLKIGKSHRKIAKLVKRNNSDISREIKRNSSPYFPYNAIIAQKACDRKARKTNKRKLDQNLPLRNWVAERLKNDWSPQQIAGRLAHFPLPHLAGKTIAYETIYQYIYSGARSINGDYWHEYLRRAKDHRRPWLKQKTKIFIPDRVSISERPKIVSSKKRIGDWEIDMMEYSRRKQGTSTHYERKSQLVKIYQLDSKKANDTTEAIRTTIESLPSNFSRTFTFDNGSENFQHIDIKNEYKVKTYFTDPYSSWQKGGVENMNGLIRQYLPRSTDLDMLDDIAIKDIEDKLNNRPRKTLGYRTPYEIIEQEKIKVLH